MIPKGDVVVSTTVLAEEDVYGRGGGLTLSGTGEFTVNKDATISGKLNPTVGIGPKTIGSITAGVSYWRWKSFRNRFFKLRKCHCRSRFWNTENRN